MNTTALEYTNVPEQGFFLRIQDRIFFTKSADKENPIGAGQFGFVFLAYEMVYHNHTYEYKENAKFAIKELLINKQNVPIVKIRNEAKLMQEIMCWEFTENIIKFVGNKDDPEKSYIVMKYFEEGTLTKFIDRISNEHEAIEYFRQICYASYAFCKNGYIHRDIKTENIYLQRNTNKSYPLEYMLILADVGDSVFYCSDKNLGEHGSPPTVAPEVGQESYDYRADVYSLGCVYFKMITGEYPFIHPNSDAIKQLKIKNLSLASKSRWNSGQISKLSHTILEGCLQYDQKYRFTFKDLDDLLNLSNLYHHYSSIKCGYYIAEDSQIINCNRHDKVDIANAKKLTISLSIPILTTENIYNKIYNAIETFTARQLFVCDAKETNELTIPNFSPVHEENVVYVIGLMLFKYLTEGATLTYPSKYKIKSSLYNDALVTIVESCLKKEPKERKSLIDIKNFCQLSALVGTATTKTLKYYEAPKLIQK